MPTTSRTSSSPTSPRRAEHAYDNSEVVDLAGVRTHVQTWAPDGAPRGTVIGLHHFYGSAQTFHRLGPLLADAGIRLVAFDRVGFGLTERPHPRGAFTGPDAPYTRAFAVAQVVALLDHLGLDRGVLTGTSMGGAIALETALAHPDRVAHVVPCASPLTGDASAPTRIRRFLRVPLLTPVGTAVVRRLGGVVDHARVSRSWHDPSGVTDADVDAHARLREADDWARGLWWKWIADDPPALLDRLPELARSGVAVTAVGAAHDRLVPPAAARRIARDTGGRHVELDSGHVVHAEGAAALAEVLVGVVGQDGEVGP